MLSNIQLELLKTFSRPLPESQLLEIKKLLADYFAQKVDDGIDELFNNNEWDVNEKVSEWTKSHDRTPYSPKK
ncbi:hypothetical protein [Lacihabitans lacunae]|jgi:hypothetical protein|uniref:Dephospho-CoA kinase n=1 Tax=Lacihabitans lacunae TaxID=1028214 RepID=A0ABV7YPR5_9BACT